MTAPPAPHPPGLPDSLPEGRFDDLAVLAGQLAGAPIALVRLTDGGRQWSIGLDAADVPRVTAFCARAIPCHEATVVPDTRRDPRLAADPLVTGPPHIRFHAGAPILADGHRPIGTICVLDTVPRADFAAAPALAALARQAGALIDPGATIRERDARAALHARLWESAHELMVVTDPQARPIAANPAFEAVFGPLPPGGGGRPMDWGPPRADHIPRMPGEDAPGPLRRRHRDVRGRDRLISWMLTRTGDRIFGVGRDETAAEAAEDELRRAQRMEAIGWLAGGIAHDFNNLLTIVIGNLDMARMRPGVADDPRLDRALAQAGEGAQRGARLTNALLAFARRQPLAPRAIDPRRHLAAARPLIERAAGGAIALEIDCGDGCWPVLADAAQLDNAILNLAVNARDAMAGPDGGRLTIAAANVTLGAREQRDRALATARFVRFSVTDTGTGMPPDVAARAFEPFFTTRAAGCGTGVGLSQVHGFASQSAGFVTLDSVPGRGTAVHVWLPRAEGPCADAAPPPAPPPPAPAARVLVVEDNDGVREMLVTTLREAGYRVIEAHDGAAGLALHARQSPPPDLVLSDVQMPNMDGPAMARAIRAQHDDARILLITGFAEAAEEIRDLPLLTKPFTRHALLARVAAMIADAPVPPS